MENNVHLIVAIGKRGEIGRKGDLIWKISDDLKRFKSLTTGHPVIMGRKTWDSLPKKPLPNRRNIILSRNKDLKAEGAEIAGSVDEALKLTRGEEPFIIGGAEIYKAFLPFVTTMHLTAVEDISEDADSFLNPELTEDWVLTEESPEQVTPDGIKFKYLTYIRNLRQA